MLAACQTGVDADRVGGFGDLVAAFFANGSDAVIATYWKIISPEVQTITPDLLASIDRQGQKGLAQELRQRMLKLAFDPPAEKPYLSHPGFWSPFFLIGVPPGG